MGQPAGDDNFAIGEQPRGESNSLDYVSNYVLRRYDYNLIFGDKEFVCSDLRYFFGHEWWKGLQFDISLGYFLANFDLGAARNLLDMHVLQHDFFNDVVLLGGELDRPRWSGSLSSGGVCAMAPPSKNPAVNAITQAVRFIAGNPIPTLIDVA